jgi:hypothetical protein
MFRAVASKMTSNIVLHYPKSDLPIKWKSPTIVMFKYKSANAFMNALSTDIKYRKCICKNTPHGIMFVQVERALGIYTNDETKFAARCIVRDIVCHKENVLEWIDDPILLRMIKGITTCKYDKIFFEMLKFNPLILIGKGIMYAILRYGTYGMMDAILDVCADKVVGIGGDEDIDLNVRINIIPILLEHPNKMGSEASDLLFAKHPMISPSFNGRLYSVMGLKIKDEVLLRYGSDLNAILQSREPEDIYYREDNRMSTDCVIV